MILELIKHRQTNFQQNQVDLYNTRSINRQNNQFKLKRKIFVQNKYRFELRLKAKR